MLTVKFDNQERKVGYSAKSYLTPTTEEAKDLLKYLFYSSDGAKMNTNSSETYGGMRVTELCRYYRLSMGMFDNGHIELKDADNNIIARADSWKPYSGEDTKRGSININESSRYSIDGKTVVRLVYDFPTHAANGNIKFIEYYARGVYENPKNKSDTRAETVKEYISPDPKFYVCYDDEGNRCIIDYKAKKMFYQGKTYSYTGEDRGTLYYFDESFWVMKSQRVEYESAPGQCVFVKLTRDEDLSTVSEGETLTIKYPKRGSDRASIAYIRSHNGKLIMVTNDYYYKGLYTVPSTVGTVTADRISLTSGGNSTAYTNYRVMPSLSGSGDSFCLYDNNVYFSFNLQDNSVTTSSTAPSKNGVLLGRNSMFENGNKYIVTDEAFDNVKPDSVLSKEVPFKIPVKITIDESLEKTKEQAMKIVLNFEIE